MPEKLQLEFSMPVRVVSEANQREHWRTKHSRKRKQQDETRWAWLEAVGKLPRFTRLAFLPSTVRLTRVGPKRLDSDNLAGSFKHVQDQVAKLIGVDDGDERIKWEYAQEAVGKRIYAVKVEVYSNET